MRILVTGGAGFIGSALVRHAGARARPRGPQRRQADLCRQPGGAGGGRRAIPRYGCVRADICDRAAVARRVRRVRAGRGRPSRRREPCRPLDRRAGCVRRRPTWSAPHVMLDAALRLLAWPAGRAAARPSASSMSRPTRSTARSGPRGGSPRARRYDPNSPYSASKAAADHLARAWHRTYGLPVILTNCSNNYGPYQFPEKLIPLTIIKALAGEPLPVYGNGENVRDWIHVEDHARGDPGRADAGPGRARATISAARSERRNIDVVARDLRARSTSCCRTARPGRASA